ncbi:MAG: hypothetical protein RR575_00325 [Acinetobacter sp.]
MIKIVYLAIVAHMITFALCVIAFVITSNIFQLLLAVFNLVMLFNALRMAADMEL